MRVLFDVNFLIALHDRRHVEHRRAHEWWAGNRGSGWASCPLTQNGLVRVLSSPSYPNGFSTAEAFATLRDNLADGGHEFWPDDVSLFDDTLFRRDRVLGPRQLTDLYLLGLAVRHGGRLATFDRSVPRSVVVGAGSVHLVCL